MQAINYRQPAYKSTSDRISTNQKLMNIRQSQIDELLQGIRDGNGRQGFSEQNGNLMYADASGTRQVVALEQRDRVMDDLWTSMGDIGLRRFHSALARKWANISLNKVRYWYNHSEVVQRFKPVQERNIVRPVTSKLPLRHLQLDLIDMSNQRSTDGMNWSLNCICVVSKFCIALPMPNKEAATTAGAMRIIIRALSLEVTGSVVQADNGTEFKGEFADLMQRTGLKMVFSKTYKSTSNAQIERMNCTIRTMLAKHGAKTGNKRNWSQVLIYR